MARLTFSLICALLAIGTAAGPAAAQNIFETLFGPPRPPADVGRGGYPPGQYPPAQRLPPGPPPSQQYPQPQYPGQYPPGARLPPGPPPGIQTQPLPPPPGTAGLPPSQRPAPRQQRTPSAAPPPSDDIITPPAAKITNTTAVFSGLDKITGRIISFDVAINETVQFGALQVTPRVCYTRPPTETQTTDSFLEVDEVTLQGEVRRIFTGWMFAASPGLNAVEHPIYDVWLVNCKGGTVVAETPEGTQAPPPPRPAQQRPAQRPRQAPPPPPEPGPPVIR